MVFPPPPMNAVPEPNKSLVACICAPAFSISCFISSTLEPCSIIFMNRSSVSSLVISKSIPAAFSFADSRANVFNISLSVMPADAKDTSASLTSD